MTLCQANHDYESATEALLTFIEVHGEPLPVNDESSRLWTQYYEAFGNLEYLLAGLMKA